MASNTALNTFLDELDDRVDRYYTLRKAQLTQERDFLQDVVKNSLGGALAEEEDRRDDLILTDVRKLLNIAG